MGLGGGEKSNVADQLAGIEAPAPMTYDQARALRGQDGRLATSYRTERPVVATYIIEYLWQRLAPRLEEFQLKSIDESLDTIGQICEQISNFLTPMVKEIVSAMARDPDPRIRDYYAEHQVLLEMTAMPSGSCLVETPSENIIINLLDGNKVIWSLIELVACRLFMDLMESDSLTLENLDGMQRDFAQIVDGKQFLRFVMKTGLSGFRFENAFFETVAARVVNQGTSVARNFLDPNFFEWGSNGEDCAGKVLKMKEGVRERVMAVYTGWQTKHPGHKKGEVRGCPAGSTNVDGYNVMAGFIKWLIEIAKKYYMPAFVAEMRKEIEARSA